MGCGGCLPANSLGEQVSGSGIDSKEDAEPAWFVMHTLYGVQQAQGEEMTAHAWLRCGSVFVTGGNGAKAYAVTAIFGDERFPI